MNSENSWDRMQLEQNAVETEYSRNSITDEAPKTVEHYIEGPGKPVLQEKQVFLVCNK